MNQWITDPEELDYAEYWAKDDSPSQMMAKNFNVERTHAENQYRQRRHLH
jgi:hypothetical protein